VSTDRRVDHRAQAERTLEMAASQTLSATDASRMALMQMATVQALMGVCDRLDRVIELLEGKGEDGDGGR